MVDDIWLPIVASIGVQEDSDVTVLVKEKAVTKMLRAAGNALNDPQLADNNIIYFQPAATYTVDVVVENLHRAIPLSYYLKNRIKALT